MQFLCVPILWKNPCKDRNSKRGPIATNKFTRITLKIKFWRSVVLVLLKLFPAANYQLCTHTGRYIHI